MVLHKAVVVDVDGALRTVDVDQRRMHEFLGGPVTICGAIPELYAVALRRRRFLWTAAAFKNSKNQKLRGEDR